MAVPNPERELERLRSTLGQALPPVVVLTGASGFFRQEALDLVLAALPKGRDVRTLDGQNETDGSELAGLRGAGLFGGGSWLVVRRGETWLAEHGEALLPLLTAIGRGCGLVLEVAKFDKRTKVGKALAAQTTFEFRDLYDSPFDRTRSPLDAELVGWVAQRSRMRSVRLGLEAAFVAVVTAGKDPAVLDGELRRLAAQPDLVARAKQRALTADDLRGKLTCAFESTPFELAEALLDSDRARCLRSLDAMFGRGVKGRDGKNMEAGGVFPFTVSWLFQALSKTHRGRLLLEQGTPPDAVAAQMGVHTFVDRYVRQVRNNPAPRLRRGLALLRDTQRRLRSTGEDQQRLLEAMVADYFASQP
jgi:DNA polymerase III delta subunit